MNKQVSIALSALCIVILVASAAVYINTNKTTTPGIISNTGSTANTNTGGVVNTPIPDQYLTYLVSQKDPTEFCDGEKMDIEGFRKTITSEVKSDISKLGMSQENTAKQTSILATKGMCQTALKEATFNIVNNKVEISPIEGWAGVSIALCSCKPEVEVNLLQLAGIQEVVWLNK